MAWLTLILTESEDAPDVTATEGIAVVTELRGGDALLPLKDSVERITMPMTAQFLDYNHRDAD